LLAIDATARIDPDPFLRNLLDPDFFSNVKGERVGDIHPLLNELRDLFVSFRLEFHSSSQ
jgi:hypothetical protein